MVKKGAYIPSDIEPKWQKKWESEGLYRTPSEVKNKKYVLDMFPYPSGATMHVGHLEGYVGTDIISRYLRMKGNSVLHPMGWDAFGLPAENYAIKTGIHPEKSTAENVETFKRQLNITGLSYDWEREINTSSPEYYKWNQWLFILMFKRGLAYKKKSPANWCPSCETVLANEQVVDGKCERCGTEVVQKEIDQWFLKITEYADRLISGLDKIDWLPEVKIQQKNWIGKSEGIEIEFSIPDLQFSIKTFTKFPETIFGVTFVVIAPEHPLVGKLATKEQSEAVDEYVQQSKKKSAIEREALEKDKTGVFTGSYCINPVNGEKVPIWVADYVIATYGTGVVMGVPGSDHRDFAFARKYDIPVIRVIGSKKGDTSAIETEVDVLEVGWLINSGEFSDLKTPDPAKERIMDYLEEKGWGRRQVQYHLHDWTISRQRYWGTPIPMVFCQKCGWQPVELSALPVLLPKDVDFEPKRESSSAYFKPTGESPIARSKSFQAGAACPNCGGSARREVDTMDTYFDSSWYFIRFVDPKNDQEFAGQEAIKRWLPVDLYIGGGHVVQHLLFARFFWKVMFDAGLLDKSLGEEPFLKLRAPGWILGPDSRKMSKRWNNVITPDDVIPKYGADAMRMYEMFMGPFEAMKPWSLTGIEGISKFIKKIWRLFEETSRMEEKEGSREAEVVINRLVKKVGEDIQNLKFNTAISSMMEAYNSLVLLKSQGVRVNWQSIWEKFLLVLAPFAPHLTEELWNRMGHKGSIHTESWPSYDPELIQEEEVTIPVQVNGKLRDTMRVKSQISNLKSQIEEEAKKSGKVTRYLDGRKIEKVVFVPGKLINFVTSAI